MENSERRIAVVTGAAGGIGRAVTRRLIDDGALVYGLDLGQGADVFTAEFPEHAHFRAVDVGQSEEVSGAIAEVHGTHGRIDVAVLCAGAVGPVAMLPDIELDAMRSVFGVNVFGIWHAMAATIPHMTAAGSGSIVVVASVAGAGASAGLAAYGASKAAALSLVRTTAIECARTGVRINAVCPGPVETPMVRLLEDARGSGDLDKGRVRVQKSIPMGRYAEAPEIADAVAYLVSDAAAFVTGAALPVDGGMWAL